MRKKSRPSGGIFELDAPWDECAIPGGGIKPGGGGGGIDILNQMEVRLRTRRKGKGEDFAIRGTVHVLMTEVNKFAHLRSPARTPSDTIHSVSPSIENHRRRRPS